MQSCIQTNRLVLRPHRASDVDALVHLIGNENVSRWLPRVPHPYTHDDAQTFMARERREAEALAITLNDQLIGGCGIDEELGYWLGEPFWGNGYATEAATALIARYFAGTEKDLNSGHRVGNDASRRVLARLGFHDTERRWHFSETEQVEVEVQHMALSAGQWKDAA